MKLSELFSSEIEQIIDFRGREIYIIVMPDVYTMADAQKVNKGDSKTVAEYIAKGLKAIGTIEDGKRVPFPGEKGKDLALTADSILENLPDSLILQINNRIEALKLSTAGKPQPPPK